MNIARRYGITGPKGNALEKGGDRKEVVRKKASGPPPAGDAVSVKQKPGAKRAQGKRTETVEAALVAISKAEREAPAGSELVPGVSTTFLVTAPRVLMERLERTRAKLGLRSRNETVVRLLEEGAEK